MLKKMFFLVLAFPTLAFCSSTKDNKLLYRLWNDFKTANIYDLNKFTSREFQSVHTDGALNKSQELTLVAGLNMTNYTLSQITRTKTHNVIVFTYQATTTETINGTPITSTTERISVFEKHGNSWYWIAHANLVPLVS